MTTRSLPLRRELSAAPNNGASIALKAPLARPSITLPPALGGIHHAFNTAVGGLGYYRSYRSVGRPLLLVHSVNAAASAAEMRPLFDHYAQRRPVYALELPGFGSSERSARNYTPRLMTDAVRVMRNEIARHHGELPIDVLGLSLGCEFAARAVLEMPREFNTLALVSPTGFEGGAALYGPPCRSRERPWLRRVLATPAIGRPLFETLVRPAVIRYFLEKSWGSAAIDEPLFAHCVATAHQPGAEHAPLAFLARQPFSADINAVYDELMKPVWLAHGTRGGFSNYDGAQHLLERDPWQRSVFDTGAMPHFEDTARFVAQYDAFLARNTLAPLSF